MYWGSTALRVTNRGTCNIKMFINTEEISGRQRSPCRYNQSTAQETSLPKYPPNLLQCQNCDYEAAHPRYLKAHSRKHNGDLIQLNRAQIKDIIIS